MEHVWYRRRRSIARGAIAAALLFVTCSSAVAQERLFGVFFDRLIELDARPGHLGRPVASIELGAFEGKLFPVAGGRLLAFTRAPFLGTFPILHHLNLVDLRTGEIREVPVGTFTGGIVASDPHVPRLYLRDDANYLPAGGFAELKVAVVDLTQMARSNFPLPYFTFKAVALHPSTGPIFVQAMGGFGGDFITVLDARTGANRSFQIPISVSVMVGAPDGSRVYVMGFGFNTFGIFAYDIATGVLLASNAALNVDWLLDTMRLDPTRNRILVSHRSNPRLVGVLNAGTLAVEAIVPLPVLTGVPTPPMQTFNAQFEYSARWDTLYVAAMNAFSPGSNQPGRPMCQSVLTRLSATTGAVLERSDVTGLLGGNNLCTSVITVVRTPEPPTATGVTTSGSVDINWTNPGNVTHFELEAGTAPGRRDIAVFQIFGTRLLLQQVPPGRYHVRVRAINDVGRSLPSNELTIVVQ